MRQPAGSKERKARAAVGLLVTLVAFMVSPGPARAQTTPQPKSGKLVCAEHFEQAQRLRNESRYIAANEQILECAKPACGEALFAECTKIYTELQSAIPSVVFAAAAKNGDELSDVQVSVDGERAAAQLDGKPVQLDPGSHTIAFSAAGYLPSQRLAVIRAGERFRPVSVVLDVEPKRATSAQLLSATTPTHHAVADSKGSAIPTASYVLAGTGILATAGFVAFRVVGASDFSRLQRDCMPSCSDAEINSVKQKYTISNVALGVGGAAFAGAFATFLHPERPIRAWHCSWAPPAAEPPRASRRPSDPLSHAPLRAL